MKVEETKKALKDMDYNERVLFFAQAPKATVGTITQIVDGDFKKYFVGKLRGQIVSRIGDGQYKFDSETEAKSCAVGFRDHSRKLAAELRVSI